MQFEVKNVALDVPFDTAFDYLSDSTRLPEWTHAFASVARDGTALMRTPDGEVTVRLEDTVNREHGIIDTRMIFPDGSVGNAYSRLVALDETACAYSFLLPPPPVALERLEGVLAEQAGVLERELQTLKARLEA